MIPKHLRICLTRKVSYKLDPPVFKHVIYLKSKLACEKNYFWRTVILWPTTNAVLSWYKNSPFHFADFERQTLQLQKKISILEDQSLKVLWNLPRYVIKDFWLTSSNFKALLKLFLQRNLQPWIVFGVEQQRVMHINYFGQKA